MFNFNMCLANNFAAFSDSKTGEMVFVDSFDHHEFHVRYGDPENSIALGTIVANSDESLNKQLHQIVASRAP